MIKRKIPYRRKYASSFQQERLPFKKKQEFNQCYQFAYRRARHQAETIAKLEAQQFAFPHFIELNVELEKMQNTTQAPKGLIIISCDQEDIRCLHTLLASILAQEKLVLD